MCADQFKMYILRIGRAGENTDYFVRGMRSELPPRHKIVQSYPVRLRARDNTRAFTTLWSGASVGDLYVMQWVMTLDELTEQMISWVEGMPISFDMDEFT